MRRWHLVTTAVILAALTTACSSGMSLQEYYDRLGDIRAQLDETGQKLQTDSSAKMESATDDAAQLAVFREYLNKSVAASEETVSQLEALEPPEEARAAHDAFVSAYNDTIAAMEEGVKASEDATTLDDAFTALTSGDVVTAGNRLNAACRDLQKVADDNDIGADLKCASSGSGGEGGQASPPP